VHFNAANRSNRSLALVNDDRVQVDHPEALVIRGGIAVFIDAGGVPTLFDHEGVSEFVGEFTPKDRKGKS
jgi:hypothetical protein